MAADDWLAWHADYAVPTSALSRRLAVVQAGIREALADCPPGPLRVLSMCAGQGHDLLGVLADHPRATDVRARLVELDPRNAAAASTRAAAVGLSTVEVRVGDAGLLDQYRDLVPADLVLACGVYGNVSDEDVARTIGYCAQLCRTGGFVLWTRHRGAPDLVPRVCQWYEDQGFVRRWVSAPDQPFGVGLHQYTAAPRPLDAGARMFTFVNAVPAGGA